MTENSDFYRDIAPIYDRMIRWERRLKIEEPLFADLWRRTGARRVLDAACGSGRHLVMFARQGLAAAGADASEGMLALAREQVDALPPAERPPLVCATWAALPERVPSVFDAVLCLGNSLPYVTDAAALRASLAGLWSRVGPGGFLLIQFKNFARLRAHGERFLPLSAHVDPAPGAASGAESVAVRQFDWHERTVDFNVILLERNRNIPVAPDDPAAGWTMRYWTTPLATWTADEVAEPLAVLGAKVTLHGSLKFEPYDETAAEDVVIQARRDVLKPD
ncbi:MAG: class I SAM-dependent methyltransferase [bacterium]|nr:class I SAM-dependent methyltransferase [bacterium]